MGSSTMPVVPDSARPSSAAGLSVSRPRPRNRARSVSHSTGPCGRPSRLRTCTAHTAGSRGSRGAPMAEQRRAVGQVFRFEKQLAEGRMREIVGRGRQDDLRVAGDVDFADPRALIDHRHPADFDVVFGGHGDVELRGDLVVVAAERRPFGAELDHVVVRLRGGRMIGGRPHRPAPHIAQVDELAARIARRVAPRLRHREAAAEAAAAAGVGHDRHVVAVRQELRVRKDRVRRSIPPHRHGRRRRDDAHFVERPRLNRRRVTRHALLQQQLGGLHSRVGVKALHHRIAEQRVRQRDQGHAGVVGEVGADHGAGGGAVRFGARRRRDGRPRARCSRWRRRIRSRPRGPPRPAAAGWPRSAADRSSRRAPWRRAPPPARRPARASGRAPERRRPCTDRCRAGRRRCRRTPRCPRARRERRRTPSGGARPSGTIHRGACPDSCA